MQTSSVTVSDISTGSPAACASTTDTGKPSRKDGNIKASIAQSSCGISERLPRKRALSDIPSLSASSPSSSVASALDGIPNIGEVRKRKLLARFKSVKAIREAELPALQSELGRAAGRAVYDHFHPKEETP